MNLTCKSNSVFVLKFQFILLTNYFSFLNILANFLKLAYFITCSTTSFDTFNFVILALSHKLNRFKQKKIMSRYYKQTISKYHSNTI